MKKIINLIFLLVIPLGMYSQKTGYYLTDSSTVFGVQPLDAGDESNCQFIYVLSGNRIDSLFPNKVRECGFADGRVYVSKMLFFDNTMKHVFLERLTDGKITLYYYKGKSEIFFTEKDSSYFTTIPKKEGKKTSYKNQLKEITADCPEIAGVANFVGYNKKSVLLFFDRYNNNCKSQPFPHFRYGIKAGYEWSKIIAPSQSLKQFDFMYEGAFTVGLFMDAPINLSDFSFNLGINYSRHGYSYNKLNNEKDCDFVANLSSLKMPILARYSVPSYKYRFFVQSGGIVEYNFNKDATYYEALVKGINSFTTLAPQTMLKNDIRFGFSIGTGYEYMVSTRNSLFFELSLNQLLYGDLRNRDILLTIGINL